MSQPEPDSAARRIAVIGAGTMGRGIAQVMAAAGVDVTLHDADPAVLATAVEAVRGRLDAAGAERLAAAGEMPAAVGGADVVIEAVPELLDLKREVLGAVSSAAGAGTVIATNTSTMGVDALADAVADPGTVVGMHFFNPVHRMRLVEVVRGPRSAPSAVAEVEALARRAGKEPIRVQDRPGFVANRLGLTLGTEAMRMLEQGVASAEHIDTAMRLGFGHPMGPFELADLVGLDARLNNLRSMHELTGAAAFSPPAVLEQLVAAGRLGRKSGEGFFRYDGDGKRITEQTEGTA